MALRSLAGQPLLALEQAGLDRVIRLRFPGADLVLDLRPRGGDVFLQQRERRTTSFRGGELRPADFATPDDPLAGLGPELRRAASARLGHAPSPDELASVARELVALPPAGFLYEAGEKRVPSFFPRPDLGDPRETFPWFYQALDQVLEHRLGVGLARDRMAELERALARRDRAPDRSGGPGDVWQPAPQGPEPASARRTALF